MAASQRGTKLLIAVLATAVMGLVIALLVVTRSSTPATPEPEARAPAPLDRDQGGFARVAPGQGNAMHPPARARNELGQPLNADGRPIGPPEKLERIRNRAIAPGEVPLIPPLFSDSAQRAQFKRWWTEEIGRRVAVYTRLEPRAGYPTDEEAAAMLDALYDAAEPRGPDESVEQAYARRQDWQRLWKQFLDTYGATLQTVVSRGGDPQYGETPPPPMQPPGVPDPAQEIPPAQPATDSPPERPAGAGGRDSIDRYQGAERADGE